MYCVYYKEIGLYKYYGVLIEITSNSRQSCWTLWQHSATKLLKSLYLNKFAVYMAELFYTFTILSVYDAIIANYNNKRRYNVQIMIMFSMENAMNIKREILKGNRNKWSSTLKINHLPFELGCLKTYKNSSTSYRFKHHTTWIVKY